MKYKRLITFDFDDTLFKTPTPHEGKDIWKDVTGKEWPYRGWWSKKESLDTEIFDVPLNPPIYKQYLKAKSDPENYVVIATGRIEPLRGEVEDILYSNDLEFDEIHLNPGMDTYDFKRNLFTDLINKIEPDLYVMYDDREEHLIRFREWAKTLPCRTIIVDAKTGEKYETDGGENDETLQLRESIKRVLKEETNISLFTRRRIHQIDKLVDVMLNDMYVDDYDNEEHFFEGLIFELGWLVRNKDFGLHDVDWGDIYDYINEHRRDDINEYYREHQKEEMNETELTERCWKGYTQKGMKTMFGKRYPNCVKKKK